MTSVSPSAAPRGLVVPILRNCDQLTMAGVEQGIADFGRKSKDGSLSFEDLTGGTFSITNGGIFGSPALYAYPESAPKCHSRYA
jgi:pyruvate/2-oxoglutarate dehydrogenase complex dihydrolipoamide acyltransferase (E2) component